MPNNKLPAGELCQQTADAIARLERELTEALDVMEEALAYIERHEDVLDGNDGLRPNEAMSLALRMRELLGIKA